MRSAIKKLEEKARLLEPSSEERKKLTDKAVAYASNFLDNIHSIRAFQESENKGSQLLDHPISEQPSDIDKLLELVKDNVDTPGLNPASGGHLGYIPGGGIYHSALGDYLADVTNRYAGVFFASPGAVRMENMLIKWMADIIGFPSTAAGNLTSGGSIANLIGITTARDALGLKAKDFDRSVIYLSEQAHHSIDKAIRIAGLNDAITRFIPLDDNHKIHPDALEKAIVEDKKKGLKPFLVIASAGTTDVGVIDPLDEIGDIAARHKLWYHIDGAYGAFFVLCEEGKKKLKGIEKADSVVMDPHKGLFLPYGSGAVLVKDPQNLQKAHAYTANYMQDARDQEELSPADLSPELTKHFRGLRMWLPLKLLGTGPFKSCLEEKLLLAKYFHREIQKIEGFEAGPDPDLSVVTYRYIPKSGDINEFNKRLFNEIKKDGEVFISSTNIGGKYILRAAVLSFRTHIDTMDTLLNKLKEKSKWLEKNFS